MKILNFKLRFSISSSFSPLVILNEHSLTECLKGLKKTNGTETIAYWSKVSRSSYKMTAVAER